MEKTWTPQQVISLARRQKIGHPYTCVNSGDQHHKDFSHEMNLNDDAALIPTVYGWICPVCGYHQPWSHENDLTFTKEGYQKMARFLLDLQEGAKSLGFYNEKTWPNVVEALNPNLSKYVTLERLKGTPTRTITILKDQNSPTNRLINAIKMVRGISGMGLREAKSLVEVSQHTRQSFYVHPDVDYEKISEFRREFPSTGYNIVDSD